MQLYVLSCLRVYFIDYNLNNISDVGVDLEIMERTFEADK